MALLTAVTAGSYTRVGHVGGRIAFLVVKAVCVGHHHTKDSGHPAPESGVGALNGAPRAGAPLDVKWCLDADGGMGCVMLWARGTLRWVCGGAVGCGVTGGGVLTSVWQIVPP